MTHYNTIEQPSEAEFKDRGSRFLAFAFSISSVEAFKKILKKIKEDHPKAVHHCYAYRLGIGGDNFRTNDDGEPSGTAGKPILGQIDSKELTDTAVIVVRYFGGTLLGVPGLINAYKTAASFALQLTPAIQKPILQPYELLYDYTLMNDVLTIVKRYKCTIVQNEMQLFCRLQIGVPKAEEMYFLEKIGDIHGVEITSLPKN